MPDRFTLVAGVAGLVLGGSLVLAGGALLGDGAHQPLDAVPVADSYDALDRVAEITITERFFVPVPLDGDSEAGVGTVEDAPVFLVRTDVGAVVVLSRSSFLGCRVVLALGEEAERMTTWEAPDPTAFVFVDPCHGGVYSLEGEHLAGPGESGLVVFPTAFTAEGGVTVDLTRPFVAGDG